MTHTEYGDRVEVTTAHGRRCASYLVIGCNAYLNELNPELPGQGAAGGFLHTATQVLEKRLRQAAAAKHGGCAIRTWRSTTTGCRPMVACCLAGACNYSGRDPRDIKAFMLPKLLRVFPELAGTATEFQWGHDRHRRQPAASRSGASRSIPMCSYAQAYSRHGLNRHSTWPPSWWPEAIRESRGFRSLQ